MTPQTVPRRPMKGPPATAVERTIMPFSRDMASAAAASSRTTLMAAYEAGLILVPPASFKTTGWFLSW